MAKTQLYDGVNLCYFKLGIFYPTFNQISKVTQFWMNRNENQEIIVSDK